MLWEDPPSRGGWDAILNDSLGNAQIQNETEMSIDVFDLGRRDYFELTHSTKDEQILWICEKNPGAGTTNLLAYAGFKTSIQAFRTKLQPSLEPFIKRRLGTYPSGLTVAVENSQIHRGEWVWENGAVIHSQNL